MTSLSQLETCANDLAGAVKALADHFRDTGLGSSDSNSSSTPPHLAIPLAAPYGVHRARRNILTSISRLQTLLAEPTDFIQQLASQSQLLACLRWLGEFQVLACIPLNDSVPTKDVADLTGVPETQLSRIVRMTATAGFLHEPKPGYIAHTALSAPFVTHLSYLDAVMFLAETAAPTALQMATATKLHGQSESKSEAPYALAFNTSQTFQSAYEQRAKLQRQWPAFLRCSGDVDDSVTEVLSRLDWLNLGTACIVDVCAHSTVAATALAELFPALHFIVQLSEPASANGVGRGRGDTSIPNDSNTRITAQKRSPGSAQTVKDAAVYILRVPTPSAGVVISQDLPSQVLSELTAHLAVLRTNAQTTFVLALRPLPDPGSVDPNIEAVARMRDLSKMQLANERDMEVGELVEMVKSVQDNRGRLVVINKLYSRNSATVALGVKYKAYSEQHHII